MFIVNIILIIYLVKKESFERFREVYKYGSCNWIRLVNGGCREIFS